VEQVGFVRYGRAGDEVAGELRMAGGEFCGNATMSAAALCLLRGTDGTGEREAVVRLRASGASEPVEVRLVPEGECGYKASVRMPRARAVELVELEHAGLSEELPVVVLEGISHVVIESDRALFSLLEQPKEAESAVRAWCAQLGADGLGLMFVEGAGQMRKLTPLVYVPGGDTVFWESSCASGSAATGMCLAERAGEPISLRLAEPGGILGVEGYPVEGDTWLTGRTRLVGEYDEL
jgi:diaminopimelate epimerase